MCIRDSLCSVLTELGRLMLPVGITIAAFTSVGYLIDLYHMECCLLYTSRCV